MSNVVPSQDTAIVTEGLAQLGEKRKGLPNIQGLVTAFLNRIQTVENTLWDVINKRMLSNATSIQLDTLGDLVGELRLGRSDADYKTAIQVQIRALRTHGRDIDLIEVAALMGYVFTYIEQWPAGWRIDQFGVSTFTNWAAAKFKITKAAGTRGDYAYTPETKVNSFIFGSAYGGVTLGVDGGGFSSAYGGTTKQGKLGAITNV